MFIQGNNNPGNFANVNNEGRIEANAISLSRQAIESVHGNSFNVNTGQITLTDDAETPLLYLKNDAENDDIIIPRFFLAFLTSTGGSGPVVVNLYKNATGGTLLSAGSDVELSNFNFGSGKTISATAKSGVTGSTITGEDETNFEFIFTGDNQRQLVTFDAIVLPRGASIVVAISAPTGNTSMVVECGFNAYLLV